MLACFCFSVLNHFVFPWIKCAEKNFLLLFFDSSWVTILTSSVKASWRELKNLSIYKVQTKGATFQFTVFHESTKSKKSAFFALVHLAFNKLVNLPKMNYYEKSTRYCYVPLPSSFLYSFFSDLTRPKTISNWTPSPLSLRKCCSKRDLESPSSNKTRLETSHKYFIHVFLSLSVKVPSACWLYSFVVSSILTDARE